ncbi:hypothetical protein NUW58_g3551 [Xylaria curta]|uniref:Uncharacterized protein n=1 Tax=Xylaria curta TaxID=42375 RepID=A0ACC1PBF2_9PEZI|nr:hypothetical protein NUW58_g3551 [Xylaria curta]
MPCLDTAERFPSPPPSPSSVEAPVSGALNIRSHHNDHHLDQDDLDADFSEYFDYDKYYDTPQHSIGGETLGGYGLSDSTPAIVSPLSVSHPCYGYSSPQQSPSPPPPSSPSPTLLSSSNLHHLASRYDQHVTALQSHAVASPLDSHSPSTQSSPTSSLDHPAPSTSISSTSPTPSARTPHARECDICHELQSDVGQLIDHLASRHPETTSDPSKPYFCGRDICSRVKSLKDFKRHLTRTAAHSQATWRCCCGYRSHRKENFRNHFKRKACMMAAPYDYVCACGRFTVDSRQNNASAIFEAHFTPCEKGQKGRPRKTEGPRQGTHDF